MKEKPTKIFFVEDDPNFGSVLKSYLEIQNFKVQWIDDGKKAIEMFVASKFDIAILDVMLPHVDGLKIAETIKKADASLPILFLTAKGQKEDILDGYKSGADDYLVKPFDSDILIYKIKALLRRNNAN
ncbi:MAG: response regulator transcription factor, partial [Bacteroidales bacterium]|nr:response regulator transcription factor [Bacteroidales bacterium]